MFKPSVENNGFGYVRKIICMLMAALLVTWMIPAMPRAFAANEDKAESVYLQLGNQMTRKDVTKTVVTLDANMGKGITIPFDVKDKYNDVAADKKRRYLVSEDASGAQSQLSETSANRVGFTSDQIVAGNKLKLVTSTKDEKGNFVKRYEQQLNVRFVDTRKAEQRPGSVTEKSSAAGMSKDGSTWSFTDGLEIKIQGTGFKFLDGTSLNLGGMMLPLKYKHENDGTTIVGINCDPDNVAFYKAVKNGNAFQKYSSDKMLKMVEQMEKGWSGKGFGKWGGKAFDWNVMGYMEFNTKNPDAPRAVNLIIQMGLKAEGHAQYLCFTGSLTFNVGGKATLTGKLTPAKGLEGKFGLGAYGALELYIGLGLNYVASIGTFGKGRIDIDFQILPKVALDTIKLSGAFGVKAKVFGFTLFTWNILKGEKYLYPKDGKKNLKAQSDEEENPFLSVDADTPYPAASRAYLDAEGELAAQASASSSTILQGIYDQTELSCVTTDEGPVIAYIADAKQIDPESTRDANNRSVVAYTRYKDGAWTKPVIVDSIGGDHKDFADYSPTISTDGQNCYVAWLAADSQIPEGETLGNLGKKLDVNVATIDPNDTIYVETVSEESNDTGSMPASPKAIKLGNELYVGWYTNQTSGSEGEVIGVSGTHAFRLFKRDTTTTNQWAQTSEAVSQSGAVTSFDVGMYGDKVACAWSLDENFSSAAEETSLNGANTLTSSTAYYMLAGSNDVQIIAQQATNAQFAKSSDADVLTYAVRNDANDGSTTPYVSVLSSSGPGALGQVVLDGAKVNLPTTYYDIAGDLGKGREGNISFLKSGDGNCNIQALVTTGAGNTDWSSIVEATADSGVIADYCATYVDGKPLFIYTTEKTLRDDSLGAQADDDASVDMNMSTDESLKHLSIIDVDYDEYEVDSGGNMPIAVNLVNDGMLDVDGVDLWMLENGTVSQLASSGGGVAMDSEGNIETIYTLPAESEFSGAHEITLYAAPKGATVTADKINRELADESAMKVSFGAASLSLETEQQVVDGQESIVATVKNDGIAPHGATLTFLDSDTGETLMAMSVPELGENETFTGTFNAPNGYFQKDGVNYITVTLEDDGTQADGYEINNTEFISAWELIEEDETPAGPEVPKTGETSQKAATTLPRTGDQTMLGLTVALLILFLAGSLVAVRVAEEARKRE